LNKFQITIFNISRDALRDGYTCLLMPEVEERLMNSTPISAILKK